MNYNDDVHGTEAINTDVILLFARGEHNEDTLQGRHYAVIDDHLNPWLRERYEGEALSYLSDAASSIGGFGTALCAGTFADFEPEPFIALLRTCAWNRPTGVQLLLREENEDLFTTVELFIPLNTDH